MKSKKSPTVRDQLSNVERRTTCVIAVKIVGARQCIRRGRTEEVKSTKSSTVRDQLGDVDREATCVMAVNIVGNHQRIC